MLVEFKKFHSADREEKTMEKVKYRQVNENKSGCCRRLGMEEIAIN